MKIFSMKTIKYPVLAALTVLLCVSLTSCGYSKSDAREMIEKANGNKLEEGDYSDMVYGLTIGLTRSTPTSSPSAT